MSESGFELLGLSIFVSIGQQNPRQSTSESALLKNHILVRDPAYIHTPQHKSESKTIEINFCIEC